MHPCKHLPNAVPYPPSLPPSFSSPSSRLVMATKFGDSRSSKMVKAYKKLPDLGDIGAVCEEVRVG